MLRIPPFYSIMLLLLALSLSLFHLSTYTKTMAR